jgi:predicted  nucleic acid-binding Zn-ribbon protein
MSETPQGGEGTSGETPAADEFKAITSQDDLNKVINDRLTRERAKYADYKDLKAKADEFDKLKAANQTEAEKTAARLAELEAELNNSRAQSMRLRVAAEHGITNSDHIRLFLTGTDEETLTEQAKAFAQEVADRKGKPPHVPREGSNSTSVEGDSRQLARELFGT